MGSEEWVVFGRLGMWYKQRQAKYIHEIPYKQIRLTNKVSPSYGFLDGQVRSKEVGT